MTVCFATGVRSGVVSSDVSLCCMLAVAVCFTTAVSGVVCQIYHCIVCHQSQVILVQESCHRRWMHLCPLHVVFVLMVDVVVELYLHEV